MSTSGDIIMAWASGREALQIVTSCIERIEAYWPFVVARPESIERTNEIAFLRQAYSEFQTIKSDIIALGKSRDEMLRRYIDPISPSQLIDWLSEYQSQERTVISSKREGKL
jgi:hypothetical protein